MLYSKDFIWFTNTGECVPIKEWDEMTHEKKPDDRIQTSELHNIFPEAKSAIKRAIKNDTHELSFILKRHKEIKDWWFLHIPNRVHLEFVQELAIVCYGNVNRQEQLEQRIKKNKLILRHFKLKDGAYGYSKATIEKAKIVSIVQILEFNRAGFAKCIWHNEKTGSLKYYARENKVWCFSCNKGGDVIDVMQTIHKISTREAIKKLCML